MFDTEPTKSEFNLAGLSVMVGIPVNRDLPWQFTKSLVETVVALEHRVIPFEVRFVTGCSIIEKARSYMVYHFLQSARNKLFWIDCDIEWKAEDFIRLLCLSTKMDIVCGVYPAKKDPPTFLINANLHEAVTLNEYGCFPLDGLGLGFVVMDRKPLQAISDISPKLKFPEIENGPIPHVFRCDSISGEFRGEDIAFFHQLKHLGYLLYLDPHIQLGHVGEKVYSGSIMDTMVKVGS